MSNIFGNTFRISVFGESHGKYIGVMIDGCPPGIIIDLTIIHNELDKRKPWQSNLTTSRKESDRVEILSGVFNDRSTGAPIVMLVENKDIDSAFYEKIKNIPRPGHADYTARVKYLGYNDYRGCGMFSGRMTVAFVIAGTIAKQILEMSRVRVLAHVIQIGKVAVHKNISNEEIEKNTYKSKVRCADVEKAKTMEQEILNAKKEGDSVGGIIECRILGIPAGIGEPIFESVESVLSHAVFSIPAVKGIEFGSGFKCATMRGSEHNDLLIQKHGKVVTITNNAGGIQGGLSNGMSIVFRVAIKPTSSISKPQKTIDLKEMKECELKIEGRHDPCITIRAVTVVESITAIALVDLLLRSNKWKK